MQHLFPIVCCSTNIAIDIDVIIETALGFRFWLALKRDKSTGPDALLLKKIAAEISNPPGLLFQRSVDSGSLLSQWRTDLVTPLYKCGLRWSQTATDQ